MLRSCPRDFFSQARYLIHLHVLEGKERSSCSARLGMTNVNNRDSCLSASPGQTPLRLTWLDMEKGRFAPLRPLRSPKTISSYVCPCPSLKARGVSLMHDKKHRHRPITAHQYIKYHSSTPSRLPDHPTTLTPPRPLHVRPSRNTSTRARQLLACPAPI